MCDLHYILEKTINAAEYRNFKKILPDRWPRTQKLGITNEKLYEFSNNENLNKLQRLNLPLLVFNIGKVTANEKDKAFFSSILKMLDWFSEQFILRDIVGSKETVKPLWTDTWDPTRLWSVISEVYYSKLLMDNGHTIEGFGRTITNSRKNADIKSKWKNRTTWVDIEALSLTKKEYIDEDNFRKLVVHRAEKKMNDKYDNLPADEIGIIASIYRAFDEVHIPHFCYQNETTKPISSDKPNIFSYVYWLRAGWEEAEGLPQLCLFNRHIPTYYVD